MKVSSMQKQLKNFRCTSIILIVAFLLSMFVPIGFCVGNANAPISWFFTDV